MKHARVSELGNEVEAMVQTMTLDEVLVLVEGLSLLDKVRLVEYVMPVIKRELVAALVYQNGVQQEQTAQVQDAAPPATAAAAIALLRSWYEQGDAEEQRETFAVLRQALPEDFPESLPVAS